MKKITLKGAGTQLFLVIIAVIQLFPLYWMVTFSLKGNMEIFGGNVLGLPEDWRFDNYTSVLEKTSLGRNMLNSFIVTGLTIFFTMLFSALSTVAILTFLASWNELMLAVTFVSDNRYKTITTGVMELIGKYSTQWGPIGAGLVMATIPILILYIALSDNVQKSLAAGAVKG